MDTLIEIERLLVEGMGPEFDFSVNITLNFNERKERLQKALQLLKEFKKTYIENTIIQEASNDWLNSHNKKSTKMDPLDRLFSDAEGDNPFERTGSFGAKGSVGPDNPTRIGKPSGTLPFSGFSGFD